MIKRPLKFKLDAYRMYVGGMSPLEAFQAASEMNDNVALSGCMTTKAYASGYMSDDIKNVLRKKIREGNGEVIAYLRMWELPLTF